MGAAWIGSNERHGHGYATIGDYVSLGQQLSAVSMHRAGYVVPCAQLIVRKIGRKRPLSASVTHELPDFANHRNMQNLNGTYVHRAGQLAHVVRLALIDIAEVQARMRRLGAACTAAKPQIICKIDLLLHKTHIWGSIRAESSHFRHSGTARTA